MITPWHADHSIAPSVAMDALLPLFDMMHAAGRGAVPAPHNNWVLWTPHVLASALEHSLESTVTEERARAALGCGGLLAGLAASHGNAPAKTAVMHSLQQRLGRLCARAAGASGPSGTARFEVEAAGLAVWLSQQSCGLPPSSQLLWRCQLRAVLDGLLSMEGLFDAARRGAPPQEASAALEARLKGRSAQLPGPIGAIRPSRRCRTRPSSLPPPRLFVVSCMH
jgi:hypothetical protein